MAGILIEHARFVEVQQRRARVVAELMKLQNRTSEAIELGEPDRHPIEVGELPGECRLMHNEVSAEPTGDAKRRRLTP